MSEEEEGSSVDFSQQEAPKEGPKKNGPVDIKSKTKKGMNWTAMFVLFVKGMSLREIADEFGIEYAKVVERARTEDWEGLTRANKHAVVPPPSKEMAPFNAEDAKEKEGRIIANRKQAFGIAKKLYSKIDEALTNLDKMVTYEKGENGEKVEVLAKFTIEHPKSIEILAKALKTTAELAMLCESDENILRSRGTDNNGKGGGPSGPSITINLPSAVMDRRQAMKPVEEAIQEVNQKAGEQLREQEVLNESAPSIEMTIMGPRRKDEAIVEGKYGASVNFDTVTK